jgi:hypothetical protein
VESVNILLFERHLVLPIFRGIAIIINYHLVASYQEPSIGNSTGMKFYNTLSVEELTKPTENIKNQNTSNEQPVTNAVRCSKASTAWRILIP